METDYSTLIWKIGRPFLPDLKDGASWPSEGEGSAAQKRSALSKLWALGHTRVQVLGEEFEHQAQSGQGVAAHWRRQAHGPSLSLRKLLWIRPTRVLGEGVPEPSVLKVQQPVARS